MYEDTTPASWHACQHITPRLKGTSLMGPRTYEISFAGQVGPAVQAEFDDCQITTGTNRTILHAELPDQCALSGLIQRIIDLRLEITHVLLITPPRRDTAHPESPYPNRG